MLLKPLQVVVTQHFSTRSGEKVGEGSVGTFEVGRVVVVLLLGVVALVVLQTSTTQEY